MVILIFKNSLYQLELSTEIFMGKIIYLGFTLKYFSQNKNKTRGKEKGRNRRSNWQNIDNFLTG